MLPLPGGNTLQTNNKPFKMGFGYRSLDGCPQDMITKCMWKGPPYIIGIIIIIIIIISSIPALFCYIRWHT
jgi:hypothetical protein